MKKPTRHVGLDVHAETIAVAVAEPDGEVRTLGVIPNRLEAIRGLIKRLGGGKGLRVCYEAGPTGYALYWQLAELGVACEVVAPTLVPVKAGDRVKTDRRDAQRLARSYRAGDLTAVWVPDAAHEALRDLVRAREAAKKDQTRARHRLSKFLLRQGRRPPEGTKAWTSKYLQWVNGLRFEHAAQEATLLDYRLEVSHQAERIDRLGRAIDAAIVQAPAQLRAVVEALQALRGVAQLTAVTLVTEVGSFSRFARPKLLMGYSGLVPSEHSSGARTHRGGITKTGNAHLRRVLVEAAWSCRSSPRHSKNLRKRQQVVSEEVRKIALKATDRLSSRYWRLTSRGKSSQQAVTALARELLGFVWAVAVQAEREAGNGAEHRAAA